MKNWMMIFYRVTMKRTNISGLSLALKSPNVPVFWITYMNAEASCMNAVLSACTVVCERYSSDTWHKLFFYFHGRGWLKSTLKKKWQLSRAFFWDALYSAGFNMSVLKFFKSHIFKEKLWLNKSYLVQISSAPRSMFIAS